MDACTGSTEGTMEDIIPTIMSALSLTDTAEEIMGIKSSDNTASCRRRQQQRYIGSTKTPPARKSVESSRRRGRQEHQQPNNIETELSDSKEGTMDDIIPTIMNAFSFRDTDVVETNHRHRRRQQQQQQQLHSDSTETASIQKTAESSNREGRQQQQYPNSIAKGHSGLTEGMIEDIMPTIVKALSFRDTSEEIIRRNSSGNTASRRHHHQQQQQQQRRIDSTQVPIARTELQPNDTNKLPTTDTEEVYNFMEAFPPMMDVFSMNDDGKGMTYEKISDFLSNGGVLSSKTTSNSNTDLGNKTQNENVDETNKSQISSSIMNVFSMIDESSNRSEGVQNLKTEETVKDQAFCSIRNVLSMEYDGTKEIQNNGIVESGMSHVYPFMTDVFSINDIDTNIALNSTEEILDNREKVSPSVPSSTRDAEKGNLSERKNKPTQKILVTRAYEVKEHYFESIFYVSISAILGSVFRVYMARIFGFDCEYKQYIDFLMPLTSNLCVTNDGRSEQTGGALFIDFPSNVFGSFLMGMITPPLDKRRARLPWLHRDHPLQRDEVFHASLGTGFCGCLTTFASWNTQMIVMLDGTYCELGSQVVTVLFGYLIGLMGASYGFQFGRQCGLWMYNYRHRDDDEISSHREGSGIDGSFISEFQPSLQNGIVLPDEGVELVDDDNVMLQPVPSHLHKIPLFLTAVALLVAFIIGDMVNGIEFYRGMTLLWILSPVGSLLRWRLSNLNAKKKGGIITNSPSWIPWGTLFANLLATAISACMEGLNHRYFFGDNPASTSQWGDAMLFALKTGVAGSLSTVSTMVKESVLLSENHPGKAKGHYYSMLTCVSCCILGLAVYATTIRLNS